MKISIDKSENSGYSLSLKSGHFCGTLDEISKDDLTTLKNGIESLIDEDNSQFSFVWNPRSQKHDKIFKD